jgi:endonuclease/exonuclease/phosphatase family metal-dependent hydrolase
MTFAFEGAPSAASAVRLRVMTYNIHHGAAAGGELCLSCIADIIQEQQADVVALQEVDRHWSARSDYADQARDLAGRLDLHYFFAPIYDLPPAPGQKRRRQYGLALLSRFPIVSQENLTLSRLSTLEERPEKKQKPGFPALTLNVEGTLLRVFGTHLDYRPDPGLRRAQVAEMLAHVGRLRTPAVLMGDFNALPAASELDPLKNVFVDAWPLSGKGPGYTYPADMPEKRIDGIYVTPAIEVDSVAVPPAQASDHRPVVAHLTVPQRSP